MYHIIFIIRLVSHTPLLSSDALLRFLSPTPANLGPPPASSAPPVASTSAAPPRSDAAACHLFTLFILWVFKSYTLCKLFILYFIYSYHIFLYFFLICSKYFDWAISFFK